MARPAKPWYRASKDAWCVYVNGKLVTLCKGKANRKEAYRLFLALDTDGKKSETTTSRKTGEEVCQLYIDHAQACLKPLTYEGYKRILEPFGKTVRKFDGNEVMPRHVTAYLDSKKEWGRTSRFNAITAIKRAWKWSHDEGYLTLNPLASMKKPRPGRRDQIPDDREIAVFIKAAKPEFKLLLTFIRETGCRPGEASMIESRHVNLINREVRFRIGEDKTSGKTDKPRVIHLNDRSLAMLAELMKAGPTGPLFRNSRGNSWTRHAMSCAVRKIRERTGLDGRTVVYALRHQWATDALARGVPLSTVAEMMGNSPEIVARVYSHLSDKKSLLLKAANDVRPNVD